MTQPAIPPADQLQIQDVARLWVTAQPVVAEFISLIIPNFHDAEDVLQEVAAAVLSCDLTKLRKPESFNAWVLGIARHKAIDICRGKGVRYLLFDSETIDCLIRSHIRLNDEAGVRRDALEQCLKRVPEKSKMLLHLRYCDGLDIKDVACRTNIGVSAVKVSLHRIRASLRGCIEQRLQRSWQ